MKQTIQKLLVVTAMLSAGITAFAYDFTVDGIYYSILSEEERTVEVTKSLSYYRGDIIIPERIIDNSTTYKVVSIGDNAFENCGGLTSVTIPNSVTTIGDKAFWNCDGLNSVTIPNSVTTIGLYAFWGCKGLIGINVDGNNKEYSSIDGVLYNKDVSELICYPCGMPLNSFSIPNSVTTIMTYAFLECDGLTSVTIPNSVTSIHDYAFFGCDGLTSVTIPNSVTTIMSSTFAGCTGLTSVTIPNSIKFIQDNAFSGCTGLTSVTIPNSVTTIGDYVFSGCTGLTSVTIGNSVTTIGRAFKNCNNIKEIYCQPVIPPSGDIAIFADEALMNATLYVPIGSKEEYEQVDPWRNFWNIEEHDFAGVEDVVGSDVDVTAENGRIIVTGAEERASIEVYSVAGQLIYNGTDTTVNAPSAGLYIVRVAGKAFKVMLQ